MIDTIKTNCVHCPNRIGFKNQLYKDDLFWIVCDAHPLVQGHVLIIPKKHISTMGSLSKNDFKKFSQHYLKIKRFLNAEYGPIGIFEHGVIGQTVFHAHTHFLPFDKSTETLHIKNDQFRKISALEEIKSEFSKKKKYLFFENINQKYLVNTDIGYPRFFRELFAKSLKVNHRANWKEAKKNPGLILQFKKDIELLKNRWDGYFN